MQVIHCRRAAPLSVGFVSSRSVNLRPQQGQICIIIIQDAEDNTECLGLAVYVY